MKILELLVGRKIMVMTDMKVQVELEIASVKENIHTQEIGPSNQANDWYPDMKSWSTYTITFTNGATKVYDSLEQIDVYQ